MSLFELTQLLHHDMHLICTTKLPSLLSYSIYEALHLFQLLQDPDTAAAMNIGGSRKWFHVPLFPSATRGAGGSVSVGTLQGYITDAFSVFGLRISAKCHAGERGANNMHRHTHSFVLIPPPPPPPPQTQPFSPFLPGPPHLF